MFWPLQINSAHFFFQVTFDSPPNSARSLLIFLNTSWFRQNFTPFVPSKSIVMNRTITWHGKAPFVTHSEFEGESKRKATSNYRRQKRCYFSALQQRTMSRPISATYDVFISCFLGAIQYVNGWLMSECFPNLCCFVYSTLLLVDIMQYICWSTCDWSNKW